MNGRLWATLWTLSKFLAMACISPMDLSLVHIDGITDLVCTVRVFDPEHAEHLMVSKVGSTPFLFDGILNEGFAAYTLFNVRVKQHAPIPVVVASSTSVIMGHHRPSWESLHSVIDLCSGFGGLSQGAVAAGFDIAVAVDQNSLMLELHGKVHEAHNICGDFGNRNVIFEAWKHSRGASVVSSGFSCQRFSRLGDGKGQLDSRASCLTKTLGASFFLNAAVVVLECVAPAANDSFVQAEIARFCQHTVSPKQTSNWTKFGRAADIELGGSCFHRNLGTFN